MPDLEVPQRSVALSQPLAVVKLYDVAIAHISEAAIKADSRDYQGQLTEVLAANEIFAGLDSCLDMDKGGTVAANLRDMYQSMISALLGSIGQADGGAICQKLADGLRPTRNAWAEIAGCPKIAES